LPFAYVGSDCVSDGVRVIDKLLNHPYSSDTRANVFEDILDTANVTLWFGPRYQTVIYTPHQ